MAEEHELKHYIEQEQILDEEQLEDAPTPSGIVDLGLIAVLSTSFALIAVFLWTQNFLSIERTLLIVLIAAAIFIATVAEIAKETRRLQQHFHGQLWRKYTYWMPTSADLPENHPKAELDTTKD